LGQNLLIPPLQAPKNLLAATEEPTKPLDSFDKQHRQLTSVSKVVGLASVIRRNQSSHGFRGFSTVVMVISRFSLFFVIFQYFLLCYGDFYHLYGFSRFSTVFHGFVDSSSGSWLSTRPARALSTELVASITR
jgi:hypothetical protein